MTGWYQQRRRYTRRTHESLVSQPFSQLDIYLNGTQVTTLTNTYPYRAMIETFLSYGEDTKKSQLMSALFYEDQPGRMDEVDFGDAARNSGLWNRSRFTQGSRIVDMIGKIHADIFFQSRYLLNEVNIKIKLVRSRTVSYTHLTLPTIYSV